MRAETDRRRQEDTNLAEAIEPSFGDRGRVILHNDSVTPYDFVIVALVRFFKLDPYRAELVTWTAHSSGTALVAVLPLSDARNKVGRAHFAAGLEGYPLMFTIEPD
jgi:ATP-dependent Clp protease adaptor protein ClpS